MSADSHTGHEAAPGNHPESFAPAHAQARGAQNSVPRPEYEEPTAVTASIRRIAVRGDEPEGYPRHWVADVLSSDGRAIHLRPIVPSDAERVIQFHSTLSERTRYLRYFGPYPVMPQRDVQRLVNIDYRWRVNFVAEVGEEIIAMGIYEGLGASGTAAVQDPGQTRGTPVTAEVAFVVSDNHQGRGLGSILLEHLAGAAAEVGIPRFEAEVLAENRQMLSVFKEAGYELRRSFDGSTIHVEFAIDPSDALTIVRNARERAAEASSVRRVLHPTSIALIGASSDLRKIGGTVLHNLLSAGFTGPIYPVNFEARSVRGVPAYASVASIPGDVDLAIVAVPAESMEQVLDDCLEKDVSTLVVVSSGFSDAGGTGSVSERRLVASARAHGMRVVGPNALGVINRDPAVSLNATLAETLPPRGKAGFFCQSGALGIAILDAAQRRGLGLSTFVSAGNRADVSGNDLLQYWDTDPETELVLLYLESFGNPRKFSRIAQRVARVKPVLVVKSGRVHPSSAAGSRATADVDDAAAETLFRQSGIIRVESVSDLFDTAILLAYQPLPDGPRLGIVDNSTALGLLARDAAEHEDLEVTLHTNLSADVSPAEFAASVGAAVNDLTVDAVMAVFVPPVAVDADAYALALSGAVKDSTKPVLTTFLATEGVPEGLAVHGEGGALTRGSLPSYAYPERGIRALGRAWRYAQWRQRPAPVIPEFAEVPWDEVRRLMDEAQPSSQGWLDQQTTRLLLEKCGIPLAPTLMAATAEEAVAAARRIGYPVAIKTGVDNWRLRADLSGVRLDVATSAEVTRAFHEVRAAAQALAAASAPAGGENSAADPEAIGPEMVTVQAMVARGTACILSLHDDPAFGSVLGFGVAGMLSELLGDRAYRVVPVSPADGAALIDEVKAAPILRGELGGQPIEREALGELVARLSAMSEELPLLRELIIDPVLTSATGAEVLHARVRVGVLPGRADTGPRRLR